MKLLRILLLAISLTTTLFVRAYDFEANGLYYDIISAGDLTCALVDGPSPYTGALMIPDEVEYLGKKLKVIEVGYTSPYYPFKTTSCNLKEVSSVQFGKNIEKISYNSFTDNQFITDITIPASIRSITSNTFKNCTSLISVTWEGDMILSYGIFYGCTKLKNLSYKSICKEIPGSAFYNCSSLSIDLSEVEEIGADAFYGCKSLKTLDLSSIKTILSPTYTPGFQHYYGTFADCGKISILILGANIEQISAKIWKNCDIDSLVILPSDKNLNIYKIDNYSNFSDANITIKGLYLGRILKSSSIPVPFSGSSVEHVRIAPNISQLNSSDNSTVGEGYFQYCKKLSNVIFEGNYIYLGANCFLETAIKDIVLPEETRTFVTSFPKETNSITFGKSFLGESISYITSLERIICTSSTPPFTDSQGKFSNTQYVSVKLFVPYGSKEAYQNAEPWKYFWNIEEMPGVDTEKVEILPLSKEIPVGDSLQLQGNRYPENAKDPIQWKSSDVKIATVSDAGLVKAVAPGKVTITATSGKASATCEVTVSPIAAQKIILSKDKVSVTVADTIKIIATVQPENTTDKTITWTSSDEKIATVSAEGIITAVKVGTATITATCGDIKATCEVTVLPITAEKIVLSKEKVSINEADTIKISATILPETTTDKTITWTTSDEKIATVSAEGIITAVKVGTATITASCGDIKATCEVTVLPITAEKIVLDLTEVSLMESDTITIKATITPETTTDKTITWTTSDEKVATVSAEGIVTAVGAGKATITATCGEISASCEVTVYSPNVNTEFADNILTVTVEGSDKPVSVSIYSVMGQCIYQKTIEQAITVTEKIDCSSLTAGTYIVQIISGEMNTSKRIVK